MRPANAIARGRSTRRGEASHRSAILLNAPTRASSVAVCVAREGASAVSEAELAAFLSPKVSRYKMPKRFFFWEALPKSGYGKIPKRMVRDELEARGLLDLDKIRAG